MIRKSKKNPEITAFILQQVAEHPSKIAMLTAEHFNITRTSANRYLSQLVKDNVLVCTGKTKARNYNLVEITDETIQFSLPSDNKEDVIWRDKIETYFENINKNIKDIFHFGVTEMLNNVIDHSGTSKYLINIKRNATRMQIIIIDYGIGIFEKIQKAYNLLDKREALLELSKGKLTSDPKNHSGEGIFWTSRMFNYFAIGSADLIYIRKMKNKDEWLIESKDQINVEGTFIKMEIDINATHTVTEIYEKYTDDEYKFTKTHVPILLAKYGDEQLVSRSQAKRVLARFEKFSEVILDFASITNIGQAFADEIFRVFKNSHPKINIFAINTTQQIDNMIKHVQNNLDI